MPKISPDSTLNNTSRSTLFAEEDHHLSDSSAGSFSSPRSAFTVVAKVKSLMPFARYSTHFYPFPPLNSLIQFCCLIDLRATVDDVYLTRFLASLQSEFIRYKSRNGKGFERIEEQIIGYLNFAIVNLEEVDESSLSDRKLAKTHNLISGIFSKALSEFLKARRIKATVPEDFTEDVDFSGGAAAGAYSSASASASAAAGVVVEKKPKLTESGKKLLISINKGKIYEVESILARRPELAIEGNEELTILSDAAFYGHVGILELIVNALNKLATEALLPQNYYGRAVGKGKDNKLPALLWAAVNGKLDALKYLCSIDGVKTSLKLIDLEEVIAEVLVSHEVEKKPNPYKEIAEFLQLIHAEFLPAAKVHAEFLPATKVMESSVKAPVDGVATTNRNQVKRLSKAIHAGDAAKVKSILTIDSSLAANGNSKKSIFSEATCFGNLEIVKLVMANLPPDYDYGQLLGSSNNQNSAVLMSALAGKMDILKFLISNTRIRHLISSRDIFWAIKKIEDFIFEKKDSPFEEKLDFEKKYDCSFHQFKVPIPIYIKIYDFLNHVYYNHTAKAMIPKSAWDRYMDCHIPGRGMMLFTPRPAEAGIKRRIEDTVEEDSDLSYSSTP